MLKKENRLTSNRAFCATYSNNSSIADDLIVLYTGKEQIETDRPTRVGFVVSKKIHKRAVIRNRIKRLMRENVRLLIKEKKITNRYKSLIFCARNNITGKNFFQINESIEKLIGKISK